MDKDLFKPNYYGIPLLDVGQSYRILAEKEARLIQVSGFDMDKLIALFAAGYTLKPPQELSLLSLEDII